MDKTTKLQNITNSINAAARIQKAYKSSMRTGSNTSVMPNRMSVLCEILSTIAESFPTPNRTAMTEAIHKSSQYHDTYRNLKNHILNLKDKRMDRDGFINTLQVLFPLLNASQAANVGKMLKIHEILKS